jgi:hypothetical protein
LDLGKAVDDAKIAMGLSGNTSVFSTDVLRVEISGPSQPHLTMVDLPGLFWAGNKDQSDDDAALVKDVVLSYMKNPRTIILAVVSAKSDFALQQVTKHARDVDPQGIRTMGLITKPDTLDEGSDSELFYVQLAQNEDVEFCLGWHVLRNRSYAERNHTTSARDAAETDFFSKGIWKSLSPSQLGISALRLRLSLVLSDQILRQLPNVLEDVTEGLQGCKNILVKLGSARANVMEQRRYLLKLSSTFSDLVRAAVNGAYTDEFFRTSYERRLRAIVQNTLADFARDMRLKGHATTIFQGEAMGEDKPYSVYRSSYIKEVMKLMKESRGRELPGTFNPLIVAELFSKQCKPWENLVHSLLERVLNGASRTISSVLHQVADEETAEALLRLVVNPSMENIRKTLRSKADEILHPHLSGHPITYDPYLIANMLEAQANRGRQHTQDRFMSFLGVQSLPMGRKTYNIDAHSLLDALATNVEPDMDKDSCYMAIDMMHEYYKVSHSLMPVSRSITLTYPRQVALKGLVDSISTLVIERYLLQKLPDILSPETVCDFTDEEVQGIAAESSESAAERARTTEKLEVLETAMVELERLNMNNTPVRRGSTWGSKFAQLN